jgi:hypothetical protein
MRCHGLIDVEKAINSVSMLCKVLKVSRSCYYDWTEHSPREIVKTPRSPSESGRSTTVAEKPWLSQNPCRAQSLGSAL